MKFLFFQLKTVSYDSYTYFSGQLAAGLRSHGHETVFFRAAEEPLTAMERFSGQTFDAVIDFNSDLPKVRMDDDRYFLDTIHAPFYDVILDHPLYHHDMLKQELTNFHVVCLDQNHRRYIRENYPHIRSVTVIPMTGSPALPEIPFPEKKPVLLFTGSYTSSAEVLAAIGQLPPFLQDDIRSIIRCMQSDPSLTMEDAVKNLFADTIVTELLPLHMQSFFLADTYLRAYYREEALRLLVSSGLPIRICGNGYEKALFFDKSSGIFIPECTFTETFTLMSQSMLCLNILPLFKNGVHDRIFSAMLNGSAVLSDGSEWISEHLRPGTELFLYRLDTLDTLPELVHELLSDPVRLQTVADAGKKEAFLHHTWQERTLAFLSLFTA